jgi:hypothetical protein
VHGRRYEEEIKNRLQVEKVCSGRTIPGADPEEREGREPDRSDKRQRSDKGVDSGCIEPDKDGRDKNRRSKDDPAEEYSP